MLANQIKTQLEFLNHLFPQSKPLALHEVGEVLPGFEARVNLYAELYARHDSSLSMIENEISLLRHFMGSANLTAKFDLFEAMRRSDDNVFEIYRFDYSQLYRSYTFMKFKTYSIIELMNFSNFDLYEREHRFSEMIQQEIGRAVESDSLIKFKVPAHKVWEKHNCELPDCHWIMKLGHCCPIYDLDLNQMIGIFVSHNTRQVFTAPFAVASPLQV